MLGKSGAERGDIRYRFVIDVPATLTAEQRGRGRGAVAR